MTFREELEKRGAREFQIVALGMDEDRALEAINEAERRGVENVIAYAIALFDNPDWTPKGARSRQQTNRVVEKRCVNCEGDRFVLVTDGPNLYDETYAPCSYCNAQADTSRWSASGEKLVTAAR